MCEARKVRSTVSTLPSPFKSDNPITSIVTKVTVVSFVPSEILKENESAP